MYRRLATTDNNNIQVRNVVSLRASICALSEANLNVLFQFYIRIKHNAALIIGVKMAARFFQEILMWGGVALDSDHN